MKRLIYLKRTEDVNQVLVGVANPLTGVMNVVALIHYDWIGDVFDVGPAVLEEGDWVGIEVNSSTV